MGCSKRRRKAEFIVLPTGPTAVLRLPLRAAGQGPGIGPAELRSAYRSAPAPLCKRCRSLCTPAAPGKASARPAALPAPLRLAIKVGVR